jgi:hypothetical protein
MLPLICFETGRNTQTQSCWAARRAAPANGCLVLFTNRNRGLEANTTPQESFLSLDALHRIEVVDREWEFRVLRSKSAVPPRQLGCN